MVDLNFWGIKVINVRPDNARPAKDIDLATANIHGSMKEGKSNRPGNAECCNGCARQSKKGGKNGCKDFTAVVDFSSGCLGKMPSQKDSATTKAEKVKAQTDSKARRRSVKTAKAFAPKTHTPHKPITMLLPQ